MSTHIRRAVLAVAIVAAPAVAQDTTAARDTSARPQTHTVVAGDNLWTLSQTYLGNPFLWPELYRLNRDIVEDPHWIYPGEILRLPGAEAVVVAVQPDTTQPQPAAPLPAAPVQPVPAAEEELKTNLFPKIQAAGGAPGGAANEPGGITSAGEVGVVKKPTVRAGEAIVAPFMDREGGPRAYGKILKSGDLPGIAQASERFRFQPFDRVMIEPPVGHVAPEGERYLAYRLGPIIENQGQIMIPTGVVEVVESPRAGAPAVAKIVRSFNEMNSTDRLIALDTAGIGRTDQPVPVTDGAQTVVRWVFGEPVLPSVQNYLILGATSRQGLKAGDELLLYRPRPKPEEFQATDPPVAIGKAQVVRSTAYGVTAIVVGQVQPSIQEGMPARVIARMP